MCAALRQPDRVQVVGRPAPGARHDFLQRHSYPAPAAVRGKMADAEPVNLGQHGAAADAATQLPRDPKGGDPLRPQTGQMVDSLVAPERGLGWTRRSDETV